MNNKLFFLYIKFPYFFHFLIFFFVSCLFNSSYCMESPIVMESSIDDVIINLPDGYLKIIRHFLRAQSSLISFSIFINEYNEIMLQNNPEFFLNLSTPILNISEFKENYTKDFLVFLETLKNSSNINAKLNLVPFRDMDAWFQGNNKSINFSSINNWEIHIRPRLYALNYNSYKSFYNVDIRIPYLAGKTAIHGGQAIPFLILKH